MFAINRFKTLVLMAGLVLVGQALGAWDGSSMEPATEQDGYYIIDSEAKLAWFANESNRIHTGEFKKNAKLTADLDMGSHLWIPICAGAGGPGINNVTYCKYTGTFDGNGHTISNLKIVSSELEEIDSLYVQNIGFIGAFTGTLKGLTLDSVIVLGEGNGGRYVQQSTSNNAYSKPVSIGTLVGWSNGKVQNCRAIGEIVTSGEGQSVGGLVGNAGGGSITGSVSEVSIDASGVAYAGGIVGYTKNKVSITSCVYAGSGVHAEGSGEIAGTTYQSEAGAVVGNTFSGSTVTVTHVYYDSTVVTKECGRNSGANQIQGEGATGLSSLNNEEVVCTLNGGIWNETDEICNGATSNSWSVGLSDLSFEGSDGYTVTFDANGGEFSHGAKHSKPMALNASISAEEIATPSRENYAFAGWATSADASEPTDDLGTVAGPTTIYAVWKPVYTITFNANQGTFPDGETTKEVRVVEGGKISEEGFAVPEKITIDNKTYFFTGWALTQKDLLPADATPDTVHLAGLIVDGAKTIYAVWTAAQIVTVTFNPNGHGTTLIDYVNVDKGQSTQKPDDPTPNKGYSFLRWCETKNPCETEFNFGSGIEENITLYASWDTVKYHITYDLNGVETTHTNPLEYTVESSFAFEDPALSEGNEFKGWFYDVNLSDPAQSIAIGTTGNKTVYAKWSVASYMVAYRAGNHGSGEVLPVTEQYGTPVVLEGASYTREGYVQDGWSRTDGGEKVFDLGANYTDYADVVLYPHWAKVDSYGALKIVHHTGNTEAVINGTYGGEDDPIAEEADTVKISSDIMVNSVTLNRTFNASRIATLCVPFEIDADDVVGADVYKFKTVVKNEVDGRWKFKVTTTNTVKPNTPYVVFPEGTQVSFRITQPVALNTATPGEKPEANNWEFIGTYQYAKFTLDSDNPIYLFANQARDGAKLGEFVRIADGAYINPMRAYLVYHKTLAKSAAGSLGSNILLPDELDIEIENENGIVVQTGTLNTVTGDIRMDRWFDLKGRRLNSRPSTKGTYYKNGKKVIIK